MTATYIPEISWHDRSPILSIDVQQNTQNQRAPEIYKIGMAFTIRQAIIAILATASMHKEIRIWEFFFTPIDEASNMGNEKRTEKNTKGLFELSVNFLSNLVSSMLTQNLREC